MSESFPTIVISEPPVGQEGCTAFYSSGVEGDAAVYKFSDVDSAMEWNSRVCNLKFSIEEMLETGQNGVPASTAADFVAWLKRVLPC